MRSVKLILVLILFGVALIIAAVVPTDINGTAGSSALGSRVMGLLGVASLVSGLVLLRKGYLAARQAQGGRPLPGSSKVLLAFCGAAVLGAVVFFGWRISDDSPSRSTAQIPGAMTKEDYVKQEQREIQRRQDNDRPAPAPAVPAQIRP